MYAEDPYETKYQFLIDKRESMGLNHFNDPKNFIEYSSDMQDVYKNIDEYNAHKELKILIVFDDMIPDIINNKKLNSIVTDLFIRGRKLNISLVFITQSYFKVPKDIRLNSSHFFIMKFQIKENFNKLHWIIHQTFTLKISLRSAKKWTAEPYPFLVNDDTLASDKPLRFRNFFLIYNKIMTINIQIKDEKLQHDINRKAAKVSALSSGKIDKYEYLTGKGILPSN